MKFEFKVTFLMLLTNWIDSRHIVFHSSSWNHCDSRVVCGKGLFTVVGHLGRSLLGCGLVLLLIHAHSGAKCTASNNDNTCNDDSGNSSSTKLWLETNWNWRAFWWRIQVQSVVIGERYLLDLVHTLRGVG